MITRVSNKFSLIKKDFQYHYLIYLFLAFLAYFLFSIFLTWPLILHLESSLFGDFGDSRGGVWQIWAHRNGFLSNPINPMVAAPYGEIVERGFSQPVFEKTLFMLGRVMGEVAAYNFFIIVAFPLVAITTYIMLTSLLNCRSAAFFGGGMFGFCPAAVMQAAGGHTAFAFNIFLPFFLLALFYHRKARGLLSSLYVALTYSLCLLTTLYFGYFSFFIGLIFFWFDIVSSDDKKRVIKSYLLIALFILAFILPYQMGAILNYLTLDNATLLDLGGAREITELFIFSSRPLEFFIPSIEHPIFGNFFYNYVRENLHGSNIPEQTLYLGFIPTILFISAVYLLFRGYLKDPLKGYFIFFSICALWMFFLSLPPQISIGTINLPTLSMLLHQIAPMFRVYSRFGILVNFFIALAIATFLAQLSRKINSKKYTFIVILSICCLGVEYRSLPFGYALSVNTPPPVYDLIAKDPDDFIVAEYPMTLNDESAYYTYLFWQRIHRKKLLNGASKKNISAYSLYLKVRDLNNPLTYDFLKDAGVKYVIVHKDMYAEGLIPKALKKYFPETTSKLSYQNGIYPQPSIPYKLIGIYGSDFLYLVE
jgi:hypothetical protein